MIFFLIKKAFFDAWDHLFTVFFLNLGCTALGALAVFCLYLSTGVSPFFLVAAVISAAGFFAWSGATAFLMGSVAEYKSPDKTAWQDALKKGWLPGLQVGMSLCAVVLLVSIALPYYLSTGGLIGIAAASVIFWFTFIAFLSLQYFLPLSVLLGGGYAKNLKKCLLLFFDNVGFSVFLALWTLILGILSVFLAMMAPGPVGIQLAAIDGLKLRLYKYDWLEKNPEAKRNAVPWYEVLEEDRELVGKRTLKGMIFPWKE